MITAGPLAVSAARLLHRLHGVFHGGRFQHQILGRIAKDEQFGQDKQVSALVLRLGMRPARQLKISLDVPHHRIELRDQDFQIFAHEEHLGWAAQGLAIGRVGGGWIERSIPTTQSRKREANSLGSEGCRSILGAWPTSPRLRPLRTYCLHANLAKQFDQ